MYRFKPVDWEGFFDIESSFWRSIDNLEDMGFIKCKKLKKNYEFLE